MDAGQIPLAQVDISTQNLEAGVSHDSLKAEQVSTVAQKLDCSSMSKGMRRYSDPFYTCFLTIGF